MTLRQLFVIKNWLFVKHLTVRYLSWQKSCLYGNRKELFGWEPLTLRASEYGCESMRAWRCKTERTCLRVRKQDWQLVIFIFSMASRLMHDQKNRFQTVMSNVFFSFSRMQRDSTSRFVRPAVRFFMFFYSLTSMILPNSLVTSNTARPTRARLG